MDLLALPDWMIWGLIAAVLLAVEMMTTAYVALGFAFGAAVVALVVFVAFPPAPPPAPTLQAELVDAERGLTLLVGVIPQEEAVTISATGPTPETGSVYELWAIDEGGAPRSLGLLDEGETRLSGVVQPGETIAVSLEPEGGSPEPAPTGPVLATALLTAP